MAITNSPDIARKNFIVIGIGINGAAQTWIRWLNEDVQPKTEVIENDSAMGVVEEVNDSDVAAKWLPGGFYVTGALSEDWFFAMGGIQMSATGVAAVHEPAEGSDPRVTVEYKIWVHDRYNWDGSKSTDIAGVTVTDKRMGALHTAGLAQEYDHDGSSSVRRYEGPIPMSGPVNLPSAHDSRDGTRSDPTR